MSSHLHTMGNQRIPASAPCCLEYPASPLATDVLESSVTATDHKTWGAVTSRKDSERSGSGDRSRPLWQRFRRTGAVTARHLDKPWTWKTQSGQTLHAQTGDWLVTDSKGGSWSVRDDIFHSTHRQVGDDSWERTGFVMARPARAGEVVHTLEGTVVAAEGDWVVKGDHGEQWPVPKDDFARRYEGPIAST
jgi:hypothetical protein